VDFYLNFHQMSKQPDMLGELTAIKKLLILQLLTDGVTQGQIATALGIDQGNLSRMIPARATKKKNPKR
jgi:hypothetical protein